MNGLEIPDQELLSAQLAEVNERLDRLGEELRVVDAEIESLAGERRRYELLRDACDALDELSELGASDLFWGEQAETDRDDEFVRIARKRMEGFESRLSAIDERREVEVGVVLYVMHEHE